MKQKSESNNCDNVCHNATHPVSHCDSLAHFQRRHHLAIETLFSYAVTKIWENEALDPRTQRDMQKGIVAVVDEFIPVLAADNPGFSADEFRFGCLIPNL